MTPYENRCWSIIEILTQRLQNEQDHNLQLQLKLHDIEKQNKELRQQLTNLTPVAQSAGF